MIPRIVIDTNVLVAALRSRNGASYALLRQIGDGRFTSCVSVALVLEYEAVLKREGLTALDESDIDAVIDYLCSLAEKPRLFFLWRPQLRDPQDEMVLELAMAGACHYIVTHNLRDFAGAVPLGVEAITPARFLKILETLS